MGRVEHGVRSVRAWTLGALLLAGCAERLGDEQLTTALSGDTQQRCIVEPPAPATTFGGGFTLDFTSGPVWIFPGASDAQGQPLGTLAARLSAADTPCGFDFEYLRDTQGDLLKLLEPDPAELDSARGELVLTPLSGFVTEWRGSERALVFYRKEFVRDFLDVETVGVGVALLDEDGLATRFAPGRYPGEPYLTWLGPQIWGRSALLSSDGFAYAYRCVNEGPFDDTCRVGRAAVESVSDAAAWEYRGAFDWEREPTRAAAILEGMGELSVAFNSHVGKYVFVFPPVLSNEVKGKLGSSPSEVNTLTHPVFDGVPDGFLGIRDVAQHPSLSKGDPGVLWFSYLTNPDQSQPNAPAPGVRLVSHRLQR